MNVLMKSAEVLVTEANGIVTIRARPVAAIVVCICGLAAAAVLMVISRALSDPLPDFARFARWGSAVVAVLSACVLMAAACVSVYRKTIIDSQKRILAKGRTVHELADVKHVAVHARHIMDTEILTINATVGDSDVLLVSGHSKKHQAQMLEAAQRMGDLIGRGSGRLDGGTTVVRSPVSARKFVGAVVTAIGLVMSVSAFLLIPDLALTRPGARFGFLFWPVGLWIAAAGAAGIVAGSVPGLLSRSEKVLLPLAFTAWAASYFLVC